MKKVLYRIREISLSFDGDFYTVEVEDLPELLRDFKNPLEAWTYFIDTVDGRVRRRIGDMLERQGRNRYTGEIANGKI